MMVDESQGKSAPPGQPSASKAPGSLLSLEERDIHEDASQPTTTSPNAANGSHQAQ